MLRAVLVDDEPLSLEALEFALAKYEEIEIIGKFTDPLKALSNIKKSKPELVFLDIEMPEFDGFSAAREIISLGLGTHIVFATVYEQYALKAFEIDATDYVVKPFSETRLKITVNRILKRLETSQGNSPTVQALVQHNLSGQIINKIPVWSENSIVLLDPAMIQYFTLAEKKVMVHTLENTYESNSTLVELEKKLENKGFFRCHKSFLINTDYIEKIIPWVHSTYQIILKEKAGQIPVSRYYTKKLREMLNL